MNDTPRARTMDALTEEPIRGWAPPRTAGRLDRWVLSRIRQRLLGIPLRLTLWDGTSVSLSDTAEVAEVWRRGSVVASWLLDLTAASLFEDPDLSGYSGRVSDSGEGRWTVLAAVDEGVPLHVLSAALFDRFESQGQAEFADRILSALRMQFGGHPEKPA